MQYKIIRKPFMLLETVGMLHKYINDIKAVETVKYRFPATDDAERKRREDCLQRMQQVQEIIDAVCIDVDRNDPMMVRFFGRVDCGCEYTCLAQLLTFSFCTLEYPGFWDHLEDICRKWKDLQERGCWIHGKSAVSLIFTDELDSPGDLIRQVKVLNYPGDFRMDLCDALNHFEDTVHQVAELIEPLSLRLEKIYASVPQLFEELWDYWEDATRAGNHVPLLEHMGLEEKTWDDHEITYLAVSCMNTNFGSNLLRGKTALNHSYNAVYVGSSATPESITVRKGVELDGISALFKCLSDKKRLEMLQRLAKERMYGQALAEVMNMDQGHVSRNLGMLNNCGLVVQQREMHRTYYETDCDALHDFFMRVENLIRN